MGKRLWHKAKWRHPDSAYFTVWDTIVECWCPWCGEALIRMDDAFQEKTCHECKHTFRLYTRLEMKRED